MVEYNPRKHLLFDPYCRVCRRHTSHKITELNHENIAVCAVCTVCGAERRINRGLTLPQKMEV